MSVVCVWGEMGLETASQLCLDLLTVKGVFSENIIYSDMCYVANYMLSV